MGHGRFRPENSMTDELLYEASFGIGRITFNRPQARNALTFAMYDRLVEICDAADADPSMRALILTGAGDRAFAAGTDISQFREFLSPQDGIDYEARIDRVLTSLERCRVPTIAAIAGACTGGGAAIAACCDLRIGAANLKFGFPIARTLGNCLSMSNYRRLSGLIGAARVKDLIFTARLMEADEACSIGLVSNVLATGADLLDRAETLASQVAGLAPLTLQVTKEALRRLGEADNSIDDSDLIVRCYTSQDFKEGMDAFLSKRRPIWTGQ